MRIVKEDSTHTEVVRSRLKKQSSKSHQTVDFETHETADFETLKPSHRERLPHNETRLRVLFQLLYFLIVFCQLLKTIA